ncbi:hypothetical protein LSTR_LSTR004683 [Laodelphax striatellus]|uniref:Uncharacterized protein n=1 Tax=Laodelphax striatellus TaxID=195883 RepID=A0A482WTQ8_LAOST|nr:hypothetical protein LSTR_LSTR004683 [Laodelphax striatellus]
MGNFVYCSTKFAAKVITEGLRIELAQNKSHIKVTNLSPGLVDTDILDAGGWDAFKVEAFAAAPKLKPEEVADAIVYALSTPPGVQISELTVRPCLEGW